MARADRFPLRAFILFTTVPAAIVGGVLFYLSTLLPDCAMVENERLPSPDGQFDLVIFARDCGATTTANTQAALIPPGDTLPEDAASFFSVGVAADLDPRWDGFGNIELSAPAGANIYRQDDSVAGVSVIYR